MWNIRKRRAKGWTFLSTLVVIAEIGSGQVPQPAADISHYIEIKLPPRVPSEDVFVRYRLSGEELGNWTQPRSGVSSSYISTIAQGRPATRIKALICAPGCAIQTLDLPISNTKNELYSFSVRPLSTVLIDGAVIRAERLYGREVKLEAKYVARWAQSFLDLDETVVTTISVGVTSQLSPDGRFRLSVPNFSQDPLASGPDHPGEFEIWATDKANGHIVALLIPAESQALKSRMGGLKIQSLYPEEITFTPCPTDRPRVHDANGFGLRPAPSDACDR
jgi:hypothetical protein